MNYKWTYWVYATIGIIACITNLVTGTTPYSHIISLALGSYIGLSLSLATDQQ